MERVTKEMSGETEGGGVMGRAPICTCGDTLGDIDPRCGVHFPSRNETLYTRSDLLSLIAAVKERAVQKKKHSTVCARGCGYCAQAKRDGEAIRALDPETILREWEKGRK